MIERNTLTLSFVKLTEIWKTAIAQAADPQRAAQYHERLMETEAAAAARRVTAE